MCIPAITAVLFSLAPPAHCPDVRWSIVLRDVEVSASLPVKVRVAEDDPLPDDGPAVNAASQSEPVLAEVPISGKD